MNELQRIGLVLWVIATVLLVTANVGANSNLVELRKSQLTQPSTVGASIHQDATLVADAQQLGLNYSGVNLSYASSLSAPDVKGAPTIGEFSYPNTIQVQSGLPSSQELQIVAYEFMHYYWQNLPSAIRQQMTTLYQQYYDNNSDFQQLTSYYVGDTATITDERNSVACTQVEPYLLTSSFNAYCNQFIKNRSILFQ